MIWQPILAQLFGVQPWMMGDFRVDEVNAMFEAANEAAQDGAG